MQSDDLGLVKRLRDHEGLGAALAHDRGQTGRYISAVMDEAAAAIERLVAERDEAREAAYDMPHGPTSRIPWSTRYSEVLADAKALRKALRQIADLDAVESALDPEWTINRARQALKDAP